MNQTDFEPSAPRSQTSLAYGRVRADILAGRLAPNERLKIAELAASLDVSPGAIREALSRLVPEQLVVSRDQKGFVVAPLSVEDLQELTDLRCEMESIALRGAVARGDSAWEAGILAAAHRLRRARRSVSDTDPSLSAEWVSHHAAFHHSLVAACGSRRLVALVGQLYEQTERYRGLSQVAAPKTRDVEGEHQELVDAALDRDAERLVAKTVSHIRRTASAIIEAEHTAVARAAATR